jgi:DNA-binding XRE family transcriptional regulator
MDEAKRKRLEAAGWMMGDYGDFLGLTEVERQHVELRIALCTGIKRLRAAKGLTQKALGKMIDSTQSRVAKVETGTVEVSLDLMFRAFFAVGGKLEDLVSPMATQSTEPEVPAARPKPKPRAKRLAKQGG